MAPTHPSRSVTLAKISKELFVVLPKTMLQSQTKLDTLKTPKKAHAN